ncbi:MAG: tRNA preQ1(34) S-adenosylmethionine ribosyltransferase-isomerase QueA [Deltaproteobacteria bacterium]|nr:tRNA preQ1(34) S-adenosylmethionine ribosyltransferase-isomerase QueA [Deltaproteobacteria bacterium]
MFKVLRGLEDYDYDLPESFIAQEPLPERGDSALMILKRSTGEIALSEFSHLDDHLPPESLLVLNNAKVTPARLYATLGESRAEVLILNPPVNSTGAGSYDLWCMVHPGRKLKIGKELTFADGDCVLNAKIIDISPSGKRLVRFLFNDAPSAALSRLGHLPLPPYIKRPDREDDRVRYQTVYAESEGAVAAPTAGLHFTAEHLERLTRKGHELARVNLRVGAGTFLPLTGENLAKGTLHEEFAEIPQETATMVNNAKAAGRTVISVGTTAVRALEWASLKRAGTKGADGSLVLGETSGFTDLFIRPGFEFRAVDALITNFHLPGSSLLMLVAAFAGLENVMNAYKTAVREKFRFFSYGDAMLIV